jgi:hypothetical protein
VFFAKGVRLGKKWWQTILGREISCSQWESPSILSRCLVFFPFKFWGGGKDFFYFSLVPNVFLLCSIQVPNVFSNMLSITPHFYPICFGNSCPPFTYIVGPKGRNSILQKRTFYFG